MIGLTPKDNELRMQVGFTLTHEANHQLIASDKDGNWKCPMETLGELLALVRQDEREACAKLCDDWLVGRDDICEVAKTIRARGNHEQD